MKIAYVADHSQKNSMDDEGAISFALTKLGHEVVKFSETCSHRDVNKSGADFLLCHHWGSVGLLQMVRLPRVFWCFDLIDYPDDPSLAPRCSNRINWARRMAEVCQLGFMTDGDWVKRNGGNLRWLPQGFDERLDGKYQANHQSPSTIIFTGTRNGGYKRSSFVREMEVRYAGQFRHVQGGVYRERLGEEIAGHRIVVAPDGPVTDDYWSNRVWNTLGLGGFLIHPYCAKLALMYQDGDDLVFYRDRRDLHEKIAKYLPMQEERGRIALNGKEITVFEHLYRHRVAKLVDQVREIL